MEQQTMAEMPEGHDMPAEKEADEAAHAEAAMAAETDEVVQQLRARVAELEDELAQVRRAAMPTAAPGAAVAGYFSPAQVRAMSPREVRENYDRIFESMSHWQ